MIKRAFSNAMQKVILIWDLPGRGFRGEIIEVKPKFAKINLLRYHDAVSYFPGWREIMFPDFDQQEIEAKKDQNKFQAILEGLKT